MEWKPKVEVYIPHNVFSVKSLCVLASQEYNQLHSCSADRAPWHLDGAGLFRSRSCDKLTG